MKYKFYYLVIFSFLFIQGQAQDSKPLPSDVEDIFNTRGELYFSFTIKNIEELFNLANVVSIDRLDGDTVFAYANKKTFIDFLSHDYIYEVLPPPSTLYTPKMMEFAEIKAVNTWDFYPTYNAYVTMMQQFETDHPALCRLYELGTLSSGRKILALKITSNINQPANKPRFNYSSSMHGDELTGYVLMLRLIDYLLNNYTTDPRITYLLDNIEIWITPLENPDGAYTNDNSTVSGATRGNANLVDLNRNYKNPLGGNHPDGQPWQEETIITMGFLDTMNFTLSANLHGGIECINYPWDTWPTAVKTHADHFWWQLVSHEYADTARFYSPANYMNPFGPSFNNGVTHGGDWYAIQGSRQDYLTYYTHSREFTLEISNAKIPPASQLPDFWNYNYRSLLNYMEQSLYGIRGIVTDSCTGQPLKAQIFLAGHDIDNSHVYSFMPLGNYHRPALAGNYNVEVSAPGYQTQTFSNVLINNYSTTFLDVALTPTMPAASIITDTIFSCNGQIQFFADILNAESWLWDFGDGSSSTEASPLHTYSANGIYYPGINLTNCTGTHFLHLGDSIVIDRPLPPVVQGDTICQPDSVVLTATGDGIIKWYANINDSVAIDTGFFFQTPLLSQTTTYYVSDTQKNYENVGETNDSINGTFYNGAVQNYLVFDCFKPLKLVSAVVNAGSSGYRAFTLRNENGQLIDSVNVFIPAGHSRIPLNINIPAGQNLQIAGPPVPDLFKSNSGISYPYEIPGYLSIKHSSHVINPTGYYYYLYDWEILTETCVSLREPVSVYLMPAPQASFNYLVDTLEVTFFNTSDDAVSYEWHFGDGQVSTQAAPVHQYAGFGTYHVMLIAFNNCGSDTITYTLELNDLPVVAHFIASENNVTEGDYVSFSDMSAPNPHYWEWNFEGGTPQNSNLQNPVIQYNTPGTYNVSLLVANSFGVDTLTKIAYINVDEAALPPEVNFFASAQQLVVGDTVYFSDSSLYNPHTWLWHFQGGTPAVSSLQNPYVVYHTPGLFFVSLIATNNFGSGYLFEDDYVNVEPLSISHINNELLKMSVFPNPAQNQVFINADKVVFVELYDMMGRVYQTSLSYCPQKNVYKLALNNVYSGLYMLKICNNTHCVTEKLFIKK